MYINLNPRIILLRTTFTNGKPPRVRSWCDAFLLTGICKRSHYRRLDKVVFNDQWVRWFVLSLITRWWPKIDGSRWKEWKAVGEDYWTLTFSSISVMLCAGVVNLKCLEEVRDPHHHLGFYGHTITRLFYWCGAGGFPGNRWNVIPQAWSLQFAPRYAMISPLATRKRTSIQTNSLSPSAKLNWTPPTSILQT